MTLEPKPKSEELVLVLPCGHPLCKKSKIFIEDLAPEALLIRHKGTISREFILNKFREAQIKPKILIETKNLSFIMEQVQAGKGVTLMLKSPLKDLIKYRPLKVRSLAADPIIINIDVVYLKNRTLSPAARAFMDVLMERKKTLNPRDSRGHS